MPVNQIGPFAFISLSGQWVLPGRQVDIVQRAGVDGTGFWLTGRRGRPFTLRSQVDAQSKELAVGFYALYRGLIGADPVPVIWSDVELLQTDSVLFAVLDVRLAEPPRALLSTSGGLNFPSLGWIECDWDLIAIEVDTQGS